MTLQPQLPMLLVERGRTVLLMRPVVLIRLRSTSTQHHPGRLMFHSDTTGVDAQLTIEPNMAAAIEARFVAPVLAGETPFMVAKTVDDLGDHEEVIAADNVVLALKVDNQLRVLIETPTWAALLIKWPYGRGQISVRASTLATAEKALETLLERLPEKEPAKDTVAIDFWQLDTTTHHSPLHRGTDVVRDRLSLPSRRWPGLA